MNELPEIETLRRDLEREVIGRKIKETDVSVPSVVSRSGNRTKFGTALEGQKIISIERRALTLLFNLDNEHVLVAKMAGNAMFRRNANQDAQEDSTTAIITFTQGGQMRLVDPSGQAEMFVVSSEDFDEHVPELAELGLDPVTSPIAWNAFGYMLMAQSTKLKTLLRDDSFIVGIGSIYSDEILFQAGLRYDRKSNDLSAQEIRRLYRAVVEVMHDAIKYRGTSLEDGTYVDVFGQPGIYQDHLSVYGKHGQLSPRSRRPIVRTKFAKEWTYFCDQSQV